VEVKLPGQRTREVALDPGDLCGHSGQKPRARPTLPGQDAGHPLQSAALHDLKRRAINVQLAGTTSGQSRILWVTRVAWSAISAGMICPIPKQKVRARTSWGRQLAMQHARVENAQLMQNSLSSGSVITAK
jgi:hypothetical protein